MSLYAALKPLGPTGFGYRTTADEVLSRLRLDGKLLLVTGASSGLGYEAARALAARGARILGLARTSEGAAGISARLGENAVGMVCDLANPHSIRDCADKIRNSGDRLDGIVCNAGIMALPRLEQAFGYELQFFTNHMGHFILVNELLVTLAEDARVVVLSSAAHHAAPRSGIEFDNLSGERRYGSVRSYGQSKLANLLFVKELASRFENSGKSALALHPGVILGTNLIRHSPVFDPVKRASAAFFTATMLKTIPQGAATSCFAVAHPGAAGLSGSYLADCNVKQPRADACDAALARHLWDVSEDIARRV